MTITPRDIRTTPISNFFFSPAKAGRQRKPQHRVQQLSLPYPSEEGSTMTITPRDIRTTPPAASCLSERVTTSRAVPT